MALKKYLVTKLFIGGLLEGLTHTEVTTVEWAVGQEVPAPYGGTSPYRIIYVRTAESLMPLMPAFKASSGRTIKMRYEPNGSQLAIADDAVNYALSAIESKELHERLDKFRAQTRAQQEFEINANAAYARYLEAQTA